MKQFFMMIGNLDRPVLDEWVNEGYKELLKHRELV